MKKKLNIDLNLIIRCVCIFLLLIVAIIFVVLGINLIWCRLVWKSYCIIAFSFGENVALMRNIALGLFGTIGLIFAYHRLHIADQQQQDAEDIQLNELHRQGATLLGEESLSTRIAGISTLKQLKSQSPEKYITSIIDLLAIFVVQSDSKTIPRKLHTHVTLPESEQLTDEMKMNLNLVRTDVTEALIVIASRSQTEQELYRAERNNRQIDLMHASLNGLFIRDVNLSQVFFYGAELVCANILNSNLAGSNFCESRMIGANFTDSDCRNCKFFEAIVCNAHFVNVDFSNASLVQICLDETNLTEANFTHADLRDSLLCGATLTGATFENANLSGADLLEAKGLTHDQLKLICHSPDSEPKIDQHLVWDKNEAIRRWIQHWKQ